MKLIKDEDIALAIQPGWLVKLLDEFDNDRYSKVYKCLDLDDGRDECYLVFELDDIYYNVICEGCYEAGEGYVIHEKYLANLDPHIMTVYKLSKRGNFIKVWERD